MSLEYRYGHWSVVHRPEGRYGKKVRIPIDKSIQGEAEAKAFHDRILAVKKAAISQKLNPRPMTGLAVGKLWDEYMKDAKLRKAASTVKDLEKTGKHVKDYLGTFPAEGIEKPHLDLYIERRNEEKASDRPIFRAINKEIDYIRGFIRWAGRNKHITPRKLEID